MKKFLSAFMALLLVFLLAVVATGAAGVWLGQRAAVAAGPADRAPVRVS